MPALNAIIIYATASGIVRRLVIPDVEPNVTGYSKYVGPGESWTLLPLAGGISDTQVLNRIKFVSNRAVIPSGRAAVVDGSGNVANVILVDTALETPPAGFTYVASDHANVGDHYNVEITNDFSRRYAVIVKLTLTVDAISWLALTGATPPDSLHFLQASPTLNVNDVITVLNNNIITSL